MMLCGLMVPRAAIGPSAVLAVVVAVVVGGLEGVGVGDAVAGGLAVDARGDGVALAVSAGRRDDGGSRGLRRPLLHHCRDSETAETGYAHHRERGKRDLEPGGLLPPAERPGPIGPVGPGHPALDPDQHRVPVRLVGLSGLPQSSAKIVH